MIKYKLVNTNSTITPISLPSRGEPLCIKPGEKNALVLGELKPEQVSAIRKLSRIGIVLRVVQETPKNKLNPSQVKVREETLAGRAISDLEGMEIKKLYAAMKLPEPRPHNREACEKAILGK